MASSTTHFVDTEFGKMYYFKAVGYTQKIESSKYPCLDNITSKMHNQIIDYNKNKFEEELLHEIRVKNNPNYREEFSKANFETKGEFPRF